ncbi:MAG: hypothetical protein KAY50_05725 [Chitinophagaceae bacterium]|nr:hypothetical protein [Chitinophagaceae bacterium]
MNRTKLLLLTTVILLLSTSISFSQTPSSSKSRFKDGLKIYLNDDSTSYLKGIGMAQLWFRYNNNNPGSTIYGTEQSKTFDVGIRRARYQFLSQVNKKVFFYSHIGINNFNSISARKTPIYFHDATAEYAIYKNHFTIGGGLSGWNGTTRYTSSSVGNILCLDLPVIMETTNDVTDQFVRKLGVYAKGQLGKFDYRFSAANPFPVQNALSPVAALSSVDTNVSFFSTRAPELQYQGYFMWQFLDKESNLLPYMTGSYLGKKRVFNIGSGFAFQNNAMWHRNTKGDTISTPLKQIGVDVFLDYYLNKEKQNAITAYVAYMNYDFGPNYIRNAGPMNMANGTNSKGSFNGAGNSMPTYGTGQVIYAQTAYLFKHDLLKAQGTLQPYVSGMFANYEKLKDPVLVYDIGLNWIQDGQKSKISLDYQSRPIFNINATGEIEETKSARRGMLVLQYQVAF